MNCATPLGAPAAAAKEVRKPVTVLFCDVTGSTELGEKLDPEAPRAVLRRYFERKQAIGAMRQAAEAGEPRAMLNLALLLVEAAPLLLGIYAVVFLVAQPGELLPEPRGGGTRVFFAWWTVIRVSPGPGLIAVTTTPAAKSRLRTPWR